MKGKFLIAALAAFVCVTAEAAIPNTEAQRLISGISRKEPLRSGVWGVLAVRMDGDTVACLNRLQKMVPASNMKLLTTGLALRTLGPQFRFETTLGYTGEIRDSTLFGDLYIIGGGDPTTGSKSDCAEPLNSLFESWAGIIRKAGISSVRGRIIGDPRYFNCAPENSGWTFDDLGTNYGVGPTGLNFYENAQRFYVTPGPTVGSRPFLMPRYPDTPWMIYTNTASTGAPKTGNDLYYVNTTFGPYGELRGHFPIDRKGYTLECSNRFGAYTCAYYFFNFLSTHGISVSGGYGDVAPQGHIRTDLMFSNIGTSAPSPSEIRSIGSTKSPALADIARDTNCESDNFYAETMLHTLGRRLGGCAEYDSCIVVESQALRNMGLKLDNACQIFDGSGLSRKNYVSPDFFVRYLRAMASGSVSAPFKASLPIPGGKGTLEHRMKDAPEAVKSRIHMKSGSMNGVVCFSGYIDSRDGNPSHTIVFSLMTNNMTCSQRKIYEQLDEIILSLAAEN